MNRIGRIRSINSPSKISLILVRTYHGGVKHTWEWLWRVGLEMGKYVCAGGSKIRVRQFYSEVNLEWGVFFFECYTGKVEIRQAEFMAGILAYSTLSKTGLLTAQSSQPERNLIRFAGVALLPKRRSRDRKIADSIPGRSGR